MPHWTELLDPAAPNGAFLPWKAVAARVGISRTTAWRLQQTGDFPKPYVVSPGRVAYRESEVEAWKASCGHRGAAAPRQARIGAGSSADAAPAAAAPTQPPSRSPAPPEAGARPAASAAAGRKLTPAPGPRTRSRRSDGDQMKFEF
jgi:predicted DNA-binding transcriptional regulator AlpA